MYLCCVCLIECVLERGLTAFCDKPFKVTASCGLNGPGLPEEGYLEQMVGWLIDLIEKHIRGSTAF